MSKPFSPSADRNKHPLLDQLLIELNGDELVMEIGSGTGQHACFFADQLSGISWQPTELKVNLPAIREWISECKHLNILPPLELDVTKPWPELNAGVCFTCNTFHIVSVDAVQSIFEGCQQVLNPGGKLLVYGPFALNGKHTSSGNEQFDQQLRASDPKSGIRDLQELDTLAQRKGFKPCRYNQMPANNLFVVWELD